MAHIHLIRHGQASFGHANYDRLSATGERQAAVLGEYYARLGLPVAALYSGDMVRQADTAEIARKSNVAWPERQVDAAFNEYDADSLFRVYLPRVLADDTELSAQLGGDLQPMFKDRKLFQRVFAQLVNHWVSDTPLAAGAKPIEKWSAFVARVEAGLKRLHAMHGKDDHVLVFTSGGAISASVRLALGLDNARTFQLNWTIANTSVSRLQARRSGLYLNSLNNTAHLDITGKPELITYR